MLACPQASCLIFKCAGSRATCIWTEADLKIVARYSTALDLIIWRYLYLSGVDIRTIIDDDTALQSGILSSLEDHNTEQLITVTLPDTEDEVRVAWSTVYLYHIWLNGGIRMLYMHIDRPLSPNSVNWKMAVLLTPDLSKVLALITWD